MILLILLLYLSYLHVAKKQNQYAISQYRCLRQTKDCSVQTPPPLRTDAAFAPNKL